MAKAVSDAPCGGQIIMSSESLAEITSLKHLMAEVRSSALLESLGSLVSALYQAGIMRWYEDGSPDLITAEPCCGY